MGGIAGGAPEAWPSLPYADWQDTCATLHLWTQVVGKIRLAQAPFLNHWWQSPFYLTSRGLTTSPMPHGRRTFQIDFDFVEHALRIETSDGARDRFDLAPMSVAAFYRKVMERLDSLGVGVRIWTHPVEIVDAIPFDEDDQHAAYDPEAAARFWRVLLQADRVLKVFRGDFIGKASPVHFFWGSFDLAVTRFSGRRAPPHPGGVPATADWVTREAYSHELSSCGFWPGNGGFGKPAFYSYAYPVPDGFDRAKVRPEKAYFSRELGEFLLDYEDLRAAQAPDEALLEFCESTYGAAADLGRWDRAALERPRDTAG